MVKNLRLLFALAAVFALVAAVACTKEVVKEIEVEKIITVEVPVEVIKEVIVKETEVQIIEVEKIVEVEVVKEVQVPGKTVIVEKEVIREIEVVKEIVVEKPVLVEVQAAAGDVVKSLNLRASSAVIKLSPFTAVSGYVGLIGNHVFSRLWMVDPHEQKFAPDLAERWEIAPDGSTVTFFLRKNAFWHDGEPVTSADIAFSLQSYMDPRTKSRAVQSLSMVKGAEKFAEGTASSVSGMKIIDDHTILFEMAFPTGQFIPAAGRSIIPEHILGNFAPEELDDNSFFVDGMIGSGPWQFVQMKPDQFHELAAATDYYLGKPKIDRVFVHLIKSPDAAQIAMQRGEIDASRRGGFSAEVNSVFLADPRFLIGATGRRNNGGGYSFNSRTSWLQDPRIRQAFIFALDRQKLVDTFEGGLAFIHNTLLFVPTGVETPEMMARYSASGDSAKAKTLLDEMGWDFDREVSAKSPTVSSPVRRAQYAAEQQMLADVGLKVIYEEMETPIWAAVYYENYNYDAVRVGGWGGAVTSLNYYFHSANTDAMGYARPEIDALLDAVPRALTNQELVDIGIQLNEYFIEDLPIVVISSPLRMYTYGAHLWIPGFGRRPQPNSLGEIVFTPEFSGQRDSWEYLMNQTDVSPFGTVHPLNVSGPIAKQILLQQ